jgi:predicted dehydrogenase
MQRKPKIAVIGVEHRHIYGQLAGMIATGCRVAGWWTDRDNDVSEGFVKRFPGVPRIADRAALLARDDVEAVLIADVPADRAARAIEAMRAGKDVMTDKPGCTTLEQLDAIRRVVAETSRIWSIDFSERFEVPAVERAAALIREGAIGKVVQTLGLGPHRLNKATRPAWFFERGRYGGILCDIASHQIDQFLYLTGLDSAEIVSSTVANYANPEYPELEDFGEIVLRGDGAHGYVRVDWYTPDALPTWGDGRLVVLGTDGYIEIRKYVDIGGRAGTDHLFVVNGKQMERIDASKDRLGYFGAFASDVVNRTETAMTQRHAFAVMELALRSQLVARRCGHLTP